jgi:hypothetical protein
LCYPISIPTPEITVSAAQLIDPQVFNVRCVPDMSNKNFYLFTHEYTGVFVRLFEGTLKRYMTLICLTDY